MGALLNKYRNLVGDEAIDRIESKASKFSETHMAHVNSTYYGGGVAELLTSLVLLSNDVGISTGWRLIKGNPDFFTVTKRFHNALQGEDIKLTPLRKKIYIDENRFNSIFTHIGNHDLIIVHDPQPLPMINFYKKKAPWLWRCHIDISNPCSTVWQYLQQFIVKYDGVIISADKYMKELPVPQHIIMPAIDPFEKKNLMLDDNTIKRRLCRIGVDLDKPLISQVSRFDKWKDPGGVIEAFYKVREKIDCQLVLIGDFAADDPEGQQIYDEIITKRGKDEGIIIINQTNNTLVNAIQTASSVVLQKSLREGFALTVSEALWKGTPVVGMNRGGIPLQIRDGKDGYLVEDINGCAKRIIKLLENPKLAEKMGESGRQHVKEKFLTTRHLEDHLDLYAKVLKK